MKRATISFLDVLTDGLSSALFVGFALGIAWGIFQLGPNIPFIVKFFLYASDGVWFLKSATVLLYSALDLFKAIDAIVRTVRRSEIATVLFASKRPRTRRPRSASAKKKSNP